ncbi:MAG: hypothetical protein P8J89_09855 [Phycisphaerales bacterium]|nr:hypothetical protein [Phycisphaerales bacterium]
MSRSSLAEFEPLDELPEFTRTALLDLLVKGTQIELRNMSARMSELGLDVLADLSWTETHGSGKNRRTVTVERTVMFFHRPECRLPDFTITHHEGFLGRLFSSRSGSVEAPSLEFKDSDSFNDKYTVQSPVPVSATTLFDETLVAALDVHDGMDAIGDQNGILAWRDSDDLIKDDKREQLAQDASAIFLPVVNDPNRGSNIAASHPGTYMNEQVARWRQDDSSEARAMLRKLITREQADDFLSQAVPRTVPSSLLKRTVGMNRSLIIAGLIAGVSGGVMIALGLIYNVGFAKGWLVFLFMLLLALGGFPMALMAWRWRRQRLRMLQRGQLIEARITTIDAEEFMKENEVVHTVVFQTVQGQCLTLELRSDPVRIARQLMYSDTSTSVLLDPERSELGVWLEGWIVENIPD